MKTFVIKMSGFIEKEAETDQDALEMVTNDDIIAAMEFDEINEVGEEKDRSICEGCGEDILESQSAVKGQNRHAACS